MPFDSFQKLKDATTRTGAGEPVDSPPAPTNHVVLVGGGELWIEKVGERSDGHKRYSVYRAREFGR